ncbi:MAG: hypothetical protein HZA08_08985, partial [Nitrospirae bacterium]|nr:hypothetical protein [Nitrospirota bacterium]
MRPSLLNVIQEIEKKKPQDIDDVENLFKVLKMKLSDFKQAGLLIRIKAGVLDGEYIYLASSAKEAETGKAEGLITYTA